mgnify:CR=1 FL=1
MLWRESRADHSDEKQVSQYREAIFSTFRYRAIMTHASVPKDQREILGISDTLVWYSWSLFLILLITLWSHGIMPSSSHWFRKCRTRQPIVLCPNISRNLLFIVTKRFPSQTSHIARKRAMIGRRFDSSDFLRLCPRKHRKITSSLQNVKQLTFSAYAFLVNSSWLRFRFVCRLD